MVLDKIVFINRAPFEHMEIDFLNCGINVLSAINGKGKTTILSHIVDAFHELAKIAFPRSYEGNLDGAYYRVLTSRYSLNSTKPAIVYVRFKNNGSTYDFVEIVGSIDEVLYDSINIENKIPYSEIAQKLSYSTQAKILSNNCTEKNIKSIFNKSLATYFPAYRFESPGYLNNSYSENLLYDLSQKYSGYLPNPIEIVSDLPQLANWLMDIVLDWNLYKDSESMQLRTALNEVLSLTLFSKTMKKVRLGIGPRSNAGSRISIVHDEGGKIQTIYPSIFEISSGEAALLCMFGEILRQSDTIGETLNCEGIVLIDEIDKHLHITIQHDILPQLFSLFPRLQFIVSSHSPFLTMGLAEMQQYRTRLIDLDNNGISNAPEENGLYKEVYEMMINENQRYASQVSSLSSTINNIKRPIIITEGKTDWKHIKAALSSFRENGEYTDLDIEIVEYEFDFGDSKLHNLLNQYGQFPQRYPIIGIFDCDEANGKNIHKEGGKRDYGHNVWGISIDIPSYRAYNTLGISIEFLYQDADLKKEDGNHRRLYVSSEFNENGRLEANLQIGVKNIHDVRKYLNPSQEKIQCDEVIDLNGSSLALSKEQFAANILNRIQPFDRMDFSAFHCVFDKIKNLINQG